MGNKWTSSKNNWPDSAFITFSPWNPRLKKYNKKCVGIKCTSRKKIEQKPNSRGEIVKNNCCWCCWTYHIKLFYYSSPGSTSSITFIEALFYAFDIYLGQDFSFNVCFILWWWKWLLNKLILLREQFTSVNTTPKHRQKRQIDLRRRRGIFLVCLCFMIKSVY